MHKNVLIGIICGTYFAPDVGVMFSVESRCYEHYVMLHNKLFYGFAMYIRNWCTSQQRHCIHTENYYFCSTIIVITESFEFQFVI